MINWLNTDTFNILELPLKRINMSSEELSQLLIDKELDKLMYYNTYKYFLSGSQLLHITNKKGNLQLIAEISDTDLSTENILDYNWYVTFKQEQQNILEISFFIMYKEDDSIQLPFIFNFEKIEERYHAAALCEQPEVSFFFLQKVDDKLFAKRSLLIEIPDVVRNILRDQLTRTFKNTIIDESKELNTYQVIIRNNKSHEVQNAAIIKSNFDLRNQSSIRVKYSVDKRRVIAIDGIDTDDIHVSNESIFNNPTCIFVEGIPLYPSKYEIVPSGEVYYHSKVPPTQNIKTHHDRNFYLDFKTIEETITRGDLSLYNTKDRPRNPTQYEIMEESAQGHVNRLIEKKLISVNENTGVTWHWCHLIAFSMLPTNKAQVQSNLVCGTSAFNGQMANVEQAVKRYIYKHNKTLSLEVTAEIIRDTHLATRLRYRIFDSESECDYTEYYNPLTTTISDVLDEETIFKRMEEKFNK